MMLPATTVPRRLVPLLTAGLAALGCQGLEHEHPGWNDGCSAPNTCYDRGCGAICSETRDCRPTQLCILMVGDPVGFCSEECIEHAGCGCHWRCVALSFSDGVDRDLCVEPCIHDEDCEAEGWWCYFGSYCRPPLP